MSDHGIGLQWTPERPTSLQTIAAHSSCVYQALFSPHTPQTIATCSTDGTLKIFDLRQPISVTPDNAVAKPALLIPAHGSEILSIDWNKYRPWVIASASVDRTAKVWDCRMIESGAAPGGGGQVGGICETSLQGHEYAVRKVQWSPHRADLLATASYDMTCRVCVLLPSFFELLLTHKFRFSLFIRWSTTPQAAQPPLRAIHDLHTEFVAGCAWSLYDEGLLASCSWDHSVHLFRPAV